MTYISKVEHQLLQSIHSEAIEVSTAGSFADLFTLRTISRRVHTGQRADIPWYGIRATKTPDKYDR